jgi:hypothetical protein
MEQAIKNNVLKGATPEVLGGLDKVSEGIEKVYADVSGKKIVIGYLSSDEQG